MNLKMTASHHHHDHDHPHEEDLEEIEPFRPAIIFDALSIDEPIPDGFDAVKIAIDGRVAADLTWKQAHEVAENHIKQGLRIFWEIDLGLFQQLNRSLDNKSQFLSLSLSLEHFRDTLWKEFKQHSIGICLYRGHADFSRQFRWDESQRANLQGWLSDHFDIELFRNETGIDARSFQDLSEKSLMNSPAGQYLISLFCRDTVAEYLALLASSLPDNIPCFALLDASNSADPYHTAQLLTKERFPNVCLGVKGNDALGGELGWDNLPLRAGILARQLPSISSSTNIRVGVCLPSMERCLPSDRDKLGEAMAMLEARQIHFRVIPEALLTTEWDGLDYLVIQPDAISAQGRRKLQGFCAAGGVIIEQHKAEDFFPTF